MVDLKKSVRKIYASDRHWSPEQAKTVDDRWTMMKNSQHRRKRSLT
ncbi:hypothetical protein [Sphingobium cloacae]|nr:hypothetical protein [Sphingobium cloacae]